MLLLPARPRTSHPNQTRLDCRPSLPSLVIAESWQAAIRRMDVSTRFVSTIVPATSGTQIQGVGADGLGNYYLADLNIGGVRLYNTTDNTMYTLAGTGTAGYADGACNVAMFNSPRGISSSVDGTKVFVSDLSNQRVRLIDRSNGGCVVSTLGGGGLVGYADGAGTNAKFSNLRELTFSALGDAYVGDYSNNAVRKIEAATGITTTVAGGAGVSRAGYKDGTGTQALFNGPRSVVMLLDGSIYVADAYNHMIRKILTSGIVVTVAGGYGTNPNQVTQPVTVPNGYLDGLGTATLFHGPSSITADASNNIYVMDNGNFRVRKISKSLFV